MPQETLQQRQPLPLAMRMTFFVVGAGLLALFWSVLCTVPGVPWNAPRLAPSFALAEGLPIYTLRSSGAQLGWVYGPIFPLVFWPVTLIPNLTVSLMMAGALNAVILVMPIFLVVRVATGRRTGVARLATLLGAVLLMSNAVTQTAFFYVHVDAVCIAFGLAAAGALHAATRGVKAGWHLAALAVVLAIWTKQLAIALVPAMIIWLWREGWSGQISSWLKWVVIYGAAVSLVFFLAFGTEQLVFNMLFVIGRGPSKADLAVLGSTVWELIAGGWFWWLTLGLVWLFTRLVAGAALPAPAASLARLLVWMAAWQAPLGLAAAMKIGGGNNSFHAIHYGLAAALVAGAGWLVQIGALPDRRTWLHAMWFCAFIGLVGVGAGFKFVLRRDAVWQPNRESERLLAYAKGRPGRLYLPWNPLVTILSDHKVYPFDDALLCLWRAGLEPPREAIQRAVPAGAEVIYQAANQSRFALRYFGDEHRRVEPVRP